MPLPQRALKLVSRMLWPLFRQPIDQVALLDESDRINISSQKGMTHSSGPIVWIRRRTMPLRVVFQTNLGSSLFAEPDVPTGRLSQGMVQ